MNPLRDQIILEMLPDKRRMHLRNGPIDLIVEAMGDAAEVAASYRQAAETFAPILDDLTAELDILRAPISGVQVPPKGPITRAMAQAADTLCGGAFATPMIAVAGAVADHVLHAMLRGRCLDRAYVNNGGDISLFLGPAQRFDVGICGDVVTSGIASVVKIAQGDKIGGIATSGWQGRSHSLGIADAVTVLAETAAQADTAATVIANAIDLPGHPGIARTRADILSPDSDLRHRLVTTGVGRLSGAECRQALEAGQRVARRLIDQGLISAAYGYLQGHCFATRQRLNSANSMRRVLPTSQGYANA
ncbi:MAG: UPF0280 family protein [Sulfitobacter sp.]